MKKIFEFIDFSKPSYEVAPQLIGAHFLVDGVGGVIVEVEAYDQLDPASHTFAGLTRQTQRWTEADRRIWRLRFQNLLGDEAMRLRAFFESLPLQGLFAFSDPWTETAYPNCRIRDARIEIACDLDGRYTVNLEIENAD